MIKLLLSIIPLTFIVSSCALQGPMVLTKGHEDFGKRVAKLNDEQIVRNLLRTKNGLYPYHFKYTKVTGKGSTTVKATVGDTEDQFETVAGTAIVEINDAADSNFEGVYQVSDEFSGDGVMATADTADVIYKSYLNSLNLLHGPVDKLPIGAIAAIRGRYLNTRGYFYISDKHGFLKLQRAIMRADASKKPQKINVIHVKP